MVPWCRAFSPPYATYDGISDLLHPYILFPFSVAPVLLPHSSGFDRSDTWGFRALEPARCSMVSIALVLLRTGTVHAGETDAIAAIDARQATQQDHALSPSGGGPAEASHASAPANPADLSVPGSHSNSMQTDPATAAAEGSQQQYVPGPDGSRIDQAQLNTAQKLLLFWRKPARKCWWDGVDIIVPVSPGEKADPPPPPGTQDDQDLSHALSEQEAQTKAQAQAQAQAQPHTQTDAQHGFEGSLGPGGRTGSTSVPGSNASPTAGMTRAEIALWKAGRGRRVRVWARRIWTLELSLL